MSTISTGLNSISTVVFKSVLKFGKTDAKTEIKRQRIFMVVLGYAIIALAYSLSFFPSTVKGPTDSIFEFFGTTFPQKYISVLCHLALL